MKIKLLLQITFIFVLTISTLQAKGQNLYNIQNQNKTKLDSSIYQMEKKWAIKLTYGRSFFSKKAQSDIEALFYFPAAMNLWKFSGSWHFSEQFSIVLNIGSQLYKNEPVRNIEELMNGDDQVLEGSGGIFLPIDLGLKYYITKKRFRPFVGLGLGFVSTKFKTVIAEGNIFSGFTRTEQLFEGRGALINLNTGFDYRMNKHIGFNLNLSNYSSSTFKAPVGGYAKYQGLAINTGFSIVF